MREILASITQRGRVTIPAEIRRALNLKHGDKAAFWLENNQARFVHSGSVVKRTAGIFKTEEPPLSAEELRRAAEEAIAEDVVERLRK